MIFAGLLSLLMACVDENRTKKEIKRNKPEAQRRVQRWDNNMKQLKELQNKRY